jgi:POT family proton-dependent oligopeptide transporter
MKSTLVVLCGETFTPNDARRESAYAYYYQGIAIGSFVAPLIVGIVSQAYGWHYGFAVAAAGMSVALGSYLSLGPRWLGDVGLRQGRAVPGSAPIGERPRSAGNRSETKLRLGLLLILALLLCAFSAAWNQLFGSWSLFAEHSINRAVGSFVVPVPWLASMNAGVVISLTPVWAVMLPRLSARNRQPDIVQKYVFALTTAGVGHLLMYGAAVIATPTSPAPLWIPIVALALMAIGELVAWTATYGVVSRAAPAGLAAMTMGAWYFLTLGLGGYVSGFSGDAIDRYGYAATFGGIALAMAIAAVVGVLLHAPLKRMATRAAVAI